MKHFKLLALLLAVACLGGCGETTPKDTPDPVPTAEVQVDPSTKTPDAPVREAKIPDATTEEKPTEEGETYKTAGMYLGKADNNLLVIIEANPQDGKPEKSYQISPEIDLEAMGIIEGNVVDITYTVDENGIKRVQTISKQY